MTDDRGRGRAAEGSNGFGTTTWLAIYKPSQQPILLVTVLHQALDQASALTTNWGSVGSDIYIYTEPCRLVDVP